MESVYLNLNHVQTNVLTWGDPFDSKDSDVIICITGNPGIPHFYEEFATELNKRTRLPICVIGQAGHVEVPDEKSNVLEGQEHLFNLEGQVQHKLDLICNKIDERRKIHLVGHSIGAWLALEVINQRGELADRIRSLDLLFPTIERMAESPNGKYLNGIVRRLHWAAMLLFSLVSWLPGAVRRGLVGAYLKWHRLPAHYEARILRYLRPAVGEKVLHLAYDEMDRVRAPARALVALARVCGRARALVGAHDGWAPPAFARDLRAALPALRVDQVDIDHTFVLASAERVAGLVADFIQPNVHTS